MTALPVQVLHGIYLGLLAGVVVAVRSNGGVDSIPGRSRTLAAGDTVYAVVRPDAARRLEAAAAPSAPDAP